MIAIIQNIYDKTSQICVQMNHEETCQNADSNGMRPKILYYYERPGDADVVGSQNTLNSKDPWCPYLVSTSMLLSFDWTF